MTRTFTKVVPTIWRCPRFKSEAVTDDARYLLLYLITCPHGNSIGCFFLPMGYVTTDLNWDQDRILIAMDVLRGAGLVDFDPSHSIVFIDEFLDASPITNQKHGTGAIETALSLPDCAPRTRVMVELSRSRFVQAARNYPDLVRFLAQIDTPIKPVQIPLSVIEERENRRERDSTPSQKTFELDAPGPDQTEQMFAIYNEIADQCRLRSATNLTDQRRQRLRHVLRHVGSIDAWRQMVIRASQSSFLNGQNAQSFRADLDFLLQQEKLVRLAEGRYDDGDRSNSAKMDNSAGLLPDRDTEKLWDQRLKGYDPGDFWAPDWGPRPEADGPHRVDQRSLERWRQRQWEASC